MLFLFVCLDIKQLFRATEVCKPQKVSTKRQTIIQFQLLSVPSPVGKCTRNLGLYIFKWTRDKLPVQLPVTTARDIY
jgi:hypothetical protein